MRELMSSDFIAIDHSPLGFGTGDREYFIDASRTRRQVSDDGISIVRSVHIEGNAAMGVHESTQITAEGNEYESVSCVLLVVDSSTHICRAEWFAEDQYADALVRLHELAAPADAVPPLENTASLLARRYIGVAFRNDAEELETLTNELVAEDFVRLDHRGSVTGVPVHGRSELMRMLRETFAVFSHPDSGQVCYRWRRNNMQTIFLYFASNPSEGMDAISSLYNQLSKNAESSFPLVSSATLIKSPVVVLPPLYCSWYVFKILKKTSSPTSSRKACRPSVPQ